MKVATEWQSFSVADTQTVRYGSESNWVEKTVAGDVTCSNDFFGLDPDYGVVKQCAVQTAPAPAPAQAPATKAPAATAPSTTTSTAGAFSGTPVAAAFVQRVEVVANDGSSGDRGNGWGGHQPRNTVHNDGTERVVYVLGPYDGSARAWRVMKRAPGGGNWTQEASGQTNSEVFLVRDPATDTAHVIAFPDEKPTIHASPSFKAVAIPGDWQLQGNAYIGAGMGQDGTLVIKTQFDQLVGGITTKDTEMHYISGKFKGSAWTFGPVVKKYIGERYAYDYILPGAFGNASEFVDVGVRDVSKEVAGLPNLSTSYAWDGVRQFKSHVNGATGWTFSDLIPKKTRSSSASEAVWMAAQDVFADSKGRLFSLDKVAEPEGAASIVLTVSDASGNRLHQGTVAGLGGNARIFEDAKNRLWLIETVNASGASVRLFRLNDNYTLGAETDLSKSFGGHGYEGYARIAAPRGGNALGDSIGGYFPVGSKLVSFRIRLPN